MEQLKKRSTALLIVLVLVLGVSGFKSRITFTYYSKTVESMFYEGVDGASIAADLESKISTAKNLIFIAEKYQKNGFEEITALNHAIESLMDADSIKAKESANAKLDEAFFALSDKLTAMALSERDENYRISLTYDFRGLNDMIDKSPYHDTVEEYLKQTTGFPASILYRISGVELSRFSGGSQ